MNQLTVLIDTKEWPLAIVHHAIMTTTVHFYDAMLCLSAKYTACYDVNYIYSYKRRKTKTDQVVSNLYTDLTHMCTH